MNKRNKIIIVGGNAAGPAAAAKAKRVNPDAEVILFEASPYISTGTCELPYLLSGEIKNAEDIIFFDPDKFYNEKGVRVFINHFVEEINTREKKIKVLNLQAGTNSTYDYDKLVLAAGSEAKKNIQLKDARNCFPIKNVSDIISIKEYIKSGNVKNIAITGSGFIGLEAAEAFSTAGYNVTLIEKSELPFPAAEPEIRHLIKELIEQKSISFFADSEIRAVITDDKISAFNINGRENETDLVINATGFSPNVYLGYKANLKTGITGALKVDTKLRTSDFNIYAAGDIIEVTDFITGKPVFNPFALYAYEFGHIAGENAAGGNATAPHVVRNVSLRLFEKFYVSVGLTSMAASENNFLINYVEDIRPGYASVMPGAGKVFGKIIFERNSNRLLGASFFGGREVEGFGNLISALIKLKQPANILAEINYNYTPPLSPMKNLLSSLGNKVMKLKK